MAFYSTLAFLEVRQDRFVPLVREHRGFGRLHSTGESEAGPCSVGVLGNLRGDLFRRLLGCLLHKLFSEPSPVESSHIFVVGASDILPNRGALLGSERRTVLVLEFSFKRIKLFWRVNEATFVLSSANSIDSRVGACICEYPRPVSSV